MSTCLDSLQDTKPVVKSSLPGQLEGLARQSYNGIPVASIRGPGSLVDSVVVANYWQPRTLTELEGGPLFTLPETPGLIFKALTGELNTRLLKPLTTGCQWLFSFTI